MDNYDNLLLKSHFSDKQNSQIASFELNVLNYLGTLELNSSFFNLKVVQSFGCY